MGETPKNRLLDVRTDVILERGSLALPAMIPYKLLPPRYRKSLPTPARQQTSFKWENQISWSAEERAALEAAAKAPTQEELSDLDVIDSMFGFVPPLPPTPSELAYENINFGSMLYMLVCGGSYYYPAPDDRYALAGRPFIQNAPLAPSSGYNQVFLCTGAEAPIRFTAIPIEKLFKLEPGARWGDQRLVVRNAKVLLDAMATYPFPAPLSAGIGIWEEVAWDKLSEVARYNGVLDAQVARFILTLLVLGTYEQASNEIMDRFEDKAKKRKRTAIIVAIALAVFSLILPALVAVGLSALMTVIDANEARQAAKDMIKAAKQFEATDAEFSREITRAAEIIDYQAAQEEKAAGLTQEERDALSEHGQEGELTPEEIAAKNKKPKIAEILVGGGVAASLVAFLLLR
jgi:hypothetical protein